VARGGPGECAVDYWDKWLSDYIATPFGGLLVFILLYLSRVLIDRWDRKAESRQKKKRKEAD